MATDTKDWSVYAAQRCEECGFDASAIGRDQIAMTALAAADRWAELLRGGAEGLTQRPAPRVWSPLEYGAHVRDVIRLFTERVAVIVSTDSPRFVGWDQEAAATAARYDQMEPAIIAPEDNSPRSTSQAAKPSMADCRNSRNVLIITE